MQKIAVKASVEQKIFNRACAGPILCLPLAFQSVDLSNVHSPQHIVLERIIRPAFPIKDTFHKPIDRTVKLFFFIHTWIFRIVRENFIRLGVRGFYAEFGLNLNGRQRCLFAYNIWTPWRDHNKWTFDLCCFTNGWFWRDFWWLRKKTTGRLEKKHVWKWILFWVYYSVSVLG